MWIRETPDGLEVNIEGVLDAIESRRGPANKKLKRVREESVDFSSSEADETFVLKAGQQYFKLVAVKEASNVEDLLKEGYERQLEAEKNRIIAECNAAVNEFKLYAEHSLREGKAEIEKLEAKLRNASPMPEISYAHAKAGLSVVKGDSGRLIWLFHTIYAPTYIDEDQLKPSIVKKMATPMVIMITTRDNVVVSLETKTIDLENFRHYHRHRSNATTAAGTGADCWGQFKWSGRELKTPSDVLSFAREASNVLSKINSSSPATRAPRGLPRLSTLQSNVVRSKPTRPTAPVTPQLNQSQIRAGLDNVIANRGGWSTS